jgi:hypothetical protein
VRFDRAGPRRHPGDLVRRSGSNRAQRMPRGGRSSRPLCRVARCVQSMPASAFLATHGQNTVAALGRGEIARTSPAPLARVARPWRATRGAGRGQEVALDQQHQHDGQAEAFEHRQSEDQIRFQSKSLRDDLRKHSRRPSAGCYPTRCARPIGRHQSRPRWCCPDRDRQRHRRHRARRRRWRRAPARGAAPRRPKSPHGSACECHRWR